MTTTRQKPPPLTLSARGQPAAPLPQLPLDGTQGVQLSLAGSDFAAVEAAAAELKARFGARFAVLDRRVSGNRSGLRIAASLLVGPGNALDAEAGEASRR